MNAIRAVDVITLLIFGSFGLWWVLFPASVVRFYSRFHGGLSLQPKLVVVRVIGGLWILLIVGLILFAERR